MSEFRYHFTAVFKYNDPVCRIIFLLFIFVFAIPVSAQNESPPFEVQLGIFDTVNEETRGLDYAAGIETFTVFSPGEKDFKYNHGAVLFPFKGYLLAQWQSSSTDEDGTDTRIMYSVSKNGKRWSNPQILYSSADYGIVTNGGWWATNDSLIAFLNFWEINENGLKEGFTKYIASHDGKKWSAPQALLDFEGKEMNGIIEQDLHALPNGRLITAFHIPPGLTAKPFFTDNPSGLVGWKQGYIENLPFQGSTSRELEPSWFIRNDGAIVMIFRDQEGSFRKLASLSLDNGETWTMPVVTNCPDSRAKQSAGNLPDGTAFQVNNPSGNKNRYPLVIILSRDGKLFNKAYLIRGRYDLQKMHYPGKFKRAGFSYPKSVIWKNYLYISYATNKEDIEISRIPLKSISLKK